MRDLLAAQQHVDRVALRPHLDRRCAVHGPFPWRWVDALADGAPRAAVRPRLERARRRIAHARAPRDDGVADALRRARLGEDERGGAQVIAVAVAPADG